MFRQGSYLMKDLNKGGEDNTLGVSYISIEQYDELHPTIFTVNIGYVRSDYRTLSRDNIPLITTLIRNATYDDLDTLCCTVMSTAGMLSIGSMVNKDAFLRKAKDAVNNTIDKCNKKSNV
jgi:hypothetical protein